MPHKLTTSDEAFDAIIDGVRYFVKHNTKTTAIVILLVCGAIIYTLMDYAKDVGKVTLSPAKPIGATFQVIPRAYAGGEPIRWMNRTWGYADPEFEVKKLAGENAILVFDKRLQTVIRLEIPALERENLKRYAK